MKLHTLLIGSLLLSFLTGCGLISNSQNDDPPSEWEKTTQVVLLNWKSNPKSLGQLLDNCVAYIRRGYQKNVCMSLKRQVAQGFLPSDFQDNLNKVAFDFPRMAKTLDKFDAFLSECLLSGDFAGTIACGQISRSVENFSNGGMSNAELVREISPWFALMSQSNSQPSFGDLLLGAGKILAEGAAQSQNANLQQWQQQQQFLQNQLMQDQIDRLRRQQFLQR